MKYLFSLIFSTIFLIGCSAIPGHTNEMHQSTPSPQAFKKNLKQAESMNETSLKDKETYMLNIEMVEKTIAGKTIQMYAYNGQIPGPTLKVAKNSTISITAKNNLNIDTMVHWHGVRVDSQNDGSHRVQSPIQPGESYTYHLKFPDSGTFWYHPHIREDLAQELGLYGAIIVEDEEKNAKNIQDHIVFLDDIAFTQTGIKSFENNTANHTLMGRFGNIQLVNGTQNPKFSFDRNFIHRIHFINAANVRAYNVGIENTQTLQGNVIASDAGLFEKSWQQDFTLISPSERFIVEYIFPKNGTYTLLSKQPEKVLPLAQIEISGDDAAPNLTYNTTENNELKTVRTEKLSGFLAQKIDKNLSIDIKLTMQDHNGHMQESANSNNGIEWEDTMGMMNEHSNNTNVQWILRDDETKKENNDIEWNFKQNTWVKIRINNPNTSKHPMQHPFHIHGQRFLVLTRNGKINENLAWKDTALIASGETVDIIVEMSNPGKWMMHCHIAEHLENGMMLNFNVQ